jgi:hypothetical protein
VTVLAAAGEAVMNKLPTTNKRLAIARPIFLIKEEKFMIKYRLKIQLNLR